MEACLPADKLARAQQAVAQWLSRTIAIKREIPSLFGQLQHTAEAVRHGCTFITRNVCKSSKGITARLLYKAK